MKETNQQQHQHQQQTNQEKLNSHSRATLLS